MDLIETDASLLARALRDTVTGGPMYIPDVRLTKASIPLTRDTTLADLQAVQADYTGYSSAITPTWQLPTISDDGVVEVIGTVPAFIPSDAVTPNNIWAVYIVKSDETAVFFMGQFDNAPLPMAGPTNQILITLRYRPGQNSVVATVS